MESTEAEGKSVTEAVEAALRKMGLRRDQVEVQILQEASAGFFGVGAKPARVRLTQKLWGEAAPDAPAAAKPARKPIGSDTSKDVVDEPRREATRDTPRREPQPRRDSPRHEAPRHESPRREAPRREPRHESPRPASVSAAPAVAVDTAKACVETESLLKEMISLMGFAAPTLTVAWDGVQERVRCGLDGGDADRLTAGDGKTLEALQFLMTLMVSRKVGGPVAVQVDAKGYWDKREKEILAQAERGVAEVRATRKPFRLPPMDASMRRLIHRSLAGHPEIETSSEGEGSWRKIVIRPKR